MTSPRAEKHLQAINDDAYLRYWILEYRLSIQEAVILDSIMSVDFITVDALYERLYGDEARSKSAVATQVNHVRKKIAKSGVKIHNIRGLGYMILKDGKAALEAVAKEAA